MVAFYCVCLQGTGKLLTGVYTVLQSIHVILIFDENKLGGCSSHPQARRWRGGAELILGRSYKLGAVVSSAPEIIKGISYGPMPCKQPCWVSQDDFFSQSAKPMCGISGVDLGQAGEFA
eukprot:Skav216431  [mRNA]  locus=scaffold3139:372013:379438:+ [translate_table: standard]